jgi:hypothetical protein
MPESVTVFEKASVDRVDSRAVGQCNFFWSRLPFKVIAIIATLDAKKITPQNTASNLTRGNCGAVEISWSAQKEIAE